jgi:hypothetical protein
VKGSGVLPKRDRNATDPHSEDSRSHHLRVGTRTSPSSGPDVEATGKGKLDENLSMYVTGVLWVDSWQRQQELKGCLERGMKLVIILETGGRYKDSMRKTKSEGEVGVRDRKFRMHGHNEHSQLTHVPQNL